MRIVAVDWVDSCMYGNWRRDQDEHTVSEITSVGFLFHKDKKCVKVIPHLADTGEGDGTMVIPRGCVKRIRYLK